MVCIARLFLGIAVAASSIASKYVNFNVSTVFNTQIDLIIGSLYIAELCSPQWAGALGSCLALSVGIGIVYCMTLGAVIDITFVSIACAVPQAIGNHSIK